MERAAFKNLIFFITLVLQINILNATTYYVNGSGDFDDENTWYNSSTGSVSGVPGAGDEITYSYWPTTPASATLTLTSDITIGDFNFSNSGTTVITITTDGNGPYTLNIDDLDIEEGLTLIIDDGVNLIVNGETSTNGGEIVFNSGSTAQFLDDVTFKGAGVDMTIESGATVSIDAYLKVTGGTNILDIAGDLTISRLTASGGSQELNILDGGSVTITTEATFSGSATFDVQNNGEMTVNSDLTISGGAAGNVDGVLIVDGTLNLGSSILTGSGIVDAAVIDCNGSGDCSSQISGSITLGEAPKTLYAIADGNWENTTVWSEDGTTACGCTPTSIDDVIIDGYEITITEDVEVASVLLSNTINNSNSTLIINDGISLVVSETVTIENTQTNSEIVKVSQNGTASMVADYLDFKGVNDSCALVELNSTSNLSVEALITYSQYGTIIVYDNAEFDYAVASNTFYGEGNSLGLNVEYENITISDGNTYYTDGKVTVNGVLTLNNGYIETGEGDSLILGSTATFVGGSDNSFVHGPVSRYISTTTKTLFPTGDFSGTTPVYAPIAVELENAGMSYYRGEYFYEAPSDATTLDTDSPDLAEISTIEKWDIHKCPVSGFANENVYVTLYFLDQARSTVHDPSKLLLAHWEGSVWESLGRTAYTDSTIRSGLMTSFSEVTVGTEETSALPVEMIDFSAEFNSNKVTLEWSTASETNNNFFTVEKSTDGIYFEEVERIFGAGNSSVQNDYSTVDLTPYSGESYYRIKQTDYDGAYTYSDLKAVSADENNELSVSLYPTLLNAGDNIYLQVDGIQLTQTIEIVVYDHQGTLIYNEAVEDYFTGEYEHELSTADNLSTGIYVVICKIGDEQFMNRIAVQ